MKIEMGESLMQSYLKYEKGCLITQTNWKTSSRWQVSDDDSQAVKAVFEKIRAHGEFSEVFKNCSLEQALRQAELDVVGIDNDKLYMVEVAFHEKGLQYGDKLETRDKIIEKMLRAYLIGLAYFPNFTYEIIFASPKVNPATDTVIKEYLSILEKDFGDGENASFRYLANDEFKDEVLVPTLNSALADSDTSELFVRSAKMLEIFGALNLSGTKKIRPVSVRVGGQSDDEDKLLRDLRTVGLSTFVQYFEYYANPQCATSDIRAMLLKSGQYKLNSCNTKASVGKSIVNRGLGIAALQIIANANNIDQECVEKAKKHLQVMS